MAPEAQRDFYLDDLKAGQRFTTASHKLTAEAIRHFAAEFDPQPFHLDEAAAQATLFGGLIASGWHTAAITMRLMVDLGVPAGIKIGIGGELTWPAPARPGDTLRAVIEVVEVTPSRKQPDRGVVITRTETLNQRDEVVQRMTAKMMAFRRPVA